MGDRLLKSRSGNVVNEDGKIQLAPFCENYLDTASGQTTGDSPVTMSSPFGANITTHYNNVTGIFTAPRDGILTTGFSFYTNVKTAVVGQYLSLSLNRVVGGALTMRGPATLCQVASSFTYTASHEISILVEAGQTFKWEFAGTMTSVALNTNSTLNGMYWKMN